MKIGKVIKSTPGVATWEDGRENVLKRGGLVELFEPFYLECFDRVQKRKSSDLTPLLSVALDLLRDVT